MNEQIKEDGLTCAYLLGKSDGYNQGKADERAEIIRIIKECVWRDADMLVELIKEQK